ncbi:hypothetical protein [Actinocrispum wychmicini]|nr:hypothetical protein [Actinocrispum wychmicini]
MLEPGGGHVRQPLDPPGPPARWVVVPGMGRPTWPTTSAPG